MIGREAILLSDDEIVDLARRKGRFTQHLVLNGDGRSSTTESQDGLASFGDELRALFRCHWAAKVIAKRLLARGGLLAEKIEFLRGFPGFIGLSLGDELVAVAVVDVEPFALEVGAVRTAADGGPVRRDKLRALVPPDPQPLEVSQETDTGRIGRPLLVGVLDADEKLASASLGKGPAKQRGAGAADMEMPRG